MILGDMSVSKNYQRLASQALVDAFAHAQETMTLAEFRERVIGELKRNILALFPDLILNSLGNPLEEGTFRFDKGVSKSFKYKNLSGGEKAAFDLILDIIVKRKAYPDSIYCIDEPESHMNTRLQGQLLAALLDVMPEKCQLWISTHSIGMMRKAQQIWQKNNESVAFLDFGLVDPDKPAKISPSRPTREFWERVLSVALDDLADLVAPSQVVVCEGNPVGTVKSRNLEFDARCYNLIFAEEFPDTKFISAGSASSVAEDRLGLVRTLPLIAKGLTSRRLIDRDDHAPLDVADFASKGVAVLSRRHIEAFLYDNEVLDLLCVSAGQPDHAGALIAEKNEALKASAARGNPVDDIKSVAGVIYVKAKQILGLVAVGNDQYTFATNTLAPLIRPGTKTYDELKNAIFG